MKPCPWGAQRWVGCSNGAICSEIVFLHARAVALSIHRPNQPEQPPYRLGGPTMNTKSGSGSPADLHSQTCAIALDQSDRLYDRDHAITT
jgi:hypothetical protein